MRIDISSIRDIKGASCELELEGPLDHMTVAGTTLQPMAPVRVFAKATSTGHGAILVQGIVKARLQAECHRCLKRFVFDAKAEFQEQYNRASHESIQRSEHRQDEVLTYYGDFVDISREVNTALVLSLPIQMLCADDCRGLCPVCGKNLNDGECACPDEVGDIRLAPIAMLYQNQDNDEF